MFSLKMTEKLILITLMYEITPYYFVIFPLFETFRGSYPLPRPLTPTQLKLTKTNQGLISKHAAPGDCAVALAYL